MLVFYAVSSRVVFLSVLSVAGVCLKLLLLPAAHASGVLLVPPRTKRRHTGPSVGTTGYFVLSSLLVIFPLIRLVNLKASKIQISSKFSVISLIIFFHLNEVQPR